MFFLLRSVYIPPFSFALPHPWHQGPRLSWWWRLWRQPGNRAGHPWGLWGPWNFMIICHTLKSLGPWNKAPNNCIDKGAWIYYVRSGWGSGVSQNNTRALISCVSVIVTGRGFYNSKNCRCQINMPPVGLCLPPQGFPLPIIHKFIFHEGFAQGTDEFCWGIPVQCLCGLNAMKTCSNSYHYKRKWQFRKLSQIQNKYQNYPQVYFMSLGAVD